MTVFQIVSEFCDRTSVDIRALVGRCRKEGIVWERFAAMSACIACGFKPEEVGRFFKRSQRTEQLEPHYHGRNAGRYIKTVKVRGERRAARKDPETLPSYGKYRGYNT